MRKLKFKVWDKIEQQWFDDDLIKLVQDGRLFFWNIGTKILEVLNNDYILVLYTGMQDKKGQEIYEGDILKYWPYCQYEEQPFIIKTPVYFKIDAFNRGRYSPLDDYSWSKCEVIGNKFENPNCYLKYESICPIVDALNRGR